MNDKINENNKMESIKKKIQIPKSVTYDISNHTRSVDKDDMQFNISVLDK